MEKSMADMNMTLGNEWKDLGQGQFSVVWLGQTSNWTQVSSATAATASWNQWANIEMWPVLICWQRSQSAQPCHCTRSRTRLVRRCLAPWSRRCCYPPLPAPQTVLLAAGVHYICMSLLGGLLVLFVLLCCIFNNVALLDHYYVKLVTIMFMV